MNAAPQSYLARVAATVAIVALAWLAWRLLDVLALVFGGVLVAAALQALAAPLQRRLHLPPRWALGTVVLGLVLLAWLLGAVLGDRMVAHLDQLREAWPRALDAATRWLASHPIGQSLRELWDNAKNGEQLWSRLAGLATMTLGALSSALLVLVIGVYLAADPALYRRGMLRLLPLEQRAAVDAALCAAGHGLQRWLLGQAMSMLSLGSMTALGLSLLGMPLALTLGVITGLLAFVPFFGAVTAGLLVVLLAFAQGPGQALQAALLMLAVQQVEEFVLQPVIQRWAVALPPVLGLIAAVVFALLFGPVGVLIATPLMVLLMILIERLYVKRVVERTAPAPRRRTAPAGAAPRPADEALTP